MSQGMRRWTLACVAGLIAGCLLLSTVHFGAVSNSDRPHGFGHWQTNQNAALLDADSAPDLPEAAFHEDAPAKKRRASALSVTRGDEPAPALPFHVMANAVAALRYAPSSIPTLPDVIASAHVVPDRRFNRGQAPPSLC